MVNTGANTARERTRRETIDEMLLKTASLARENDQAVLRLRGFLVGAPAEDKVPELGAQSGWLGEIADIPEVTLEHLADTAKVLEELSQQVVAPQTPTPIGPRR